MIRINLAPKNEGGGRGFRLSLPSLNLGVLFALVAVLFGTAIGAGWWHFTREETRLAGEVEAGARELQSLKTTVGSAGNIRQQLGELEARLKALQVLSRDQGRLTLLVDAFVDTVPADLWITALEEKNTLVRVTGAAFSPTAVANFMSALRASGRFKDVDIVLSKQDFAKSPSLVSFEVTCRFEG